ncbi:hypothetical protein AC739_19545, partial [Planococcus glaciei]|uniref:cupin domain-containing protein n=1 Tax=Planococcus glaciei TaxID=459472 RepID=UPI0006BF334D
VIMSQEKFLYRKSTLLEPKQSRREGLKERLLLSQRESCHQNVVLVDIEQDAEVELHQIQNSESIFVLKGIFEVILQDSTQRIEPGDLYYFPPHTSHGLICKEGPGQFLAIFSPSGKNDINNEWLRTLYSEAWKQYSHEDNISQKRNNLFLAVQAALIATLTGASGILLKLKALKVGSYELWIGHLALGFILIVFWYFANRLTSFWESV